MLLSTMTEARETEALRQQMHTSYGAWQLGFRLGAQQLEFIGALTGTKVNLEKYAETYPSFRDYLRSLGLVD